MKSSPGKKLGPQIYVHKSCVRETDIPEKVLIVGERMCRGKNWEYEIVKYDSLNNIISFIQSPDFDVSDEPIAGDRLIVYSSTEFRYWYSPEIPFIYHHKWMMVNEDYKGFDIQGSKDRSKAIKGLTFYSKRDSWLKELDKHGISSKIAQYGNSKA